jgi:serine/threonine-protein kinase
VSRHPPDPDPAVADTSSPGPDPAKDARVAELRGKGPRQVRSGDTLGRYELGDELGEGGMAMVFRARDRELRRDVAVKVLFPHLARRAEIVQRFHREARAAAGLEHPNILRIYDVGGGDGDEPPHIVMELIRGRTLLQEIEQRGAMLAEIAACIGALLGDALAAAHAAGVIHRDVKPANVLIAPGGRLLLADFGVARLEREDSLVTRTGALLGTPAYMSPEQAIGETATARSDLYSLGATLYQLATGALPYSGSPAKVMSLVATGGMLAPVRRQPSCGADLSRLIERAMAVDPNARPAGATAIASELRGFAAAGGLGDASEELAAYFEDPERFLRARTPIVISALVEAARTAVSADKLPRAMALADRASALAPGDPGVAALIEAVTGGGRASARRRHLAIAGAAVALAAAVTGAAWRLARTGDGPAALTPALGSQGASDAAAGFAGPGAPGAPGTAVDAMPGPGRDAGARPSAGINVTTEPASDHGGLAPAPDAVGLPIDSADASAGSARAITAPRATRSPAGLPPRSDDRRSGSPPSAAPRSGAPAGPGDASRPALSPPAPRVPGSTEPSGPPIAAPDPVAPASAAPPAPVDAAAAPVGPSAHLIVHNDVWCSIWIDGSERGNRRDQALEVAAGHHVVRCVNPIGQWQQEVDVAPGATQSLNGSLLRELVIQVAVDATIDGKRYARGATVVRKPGYAEVIVDGKKQFLPFRSSCTLTDQPAVGCYPGAGSAAPANP